MSSSSSTTRDVKPNSGVNRTVTRFQSIITWILLVFWVFLMAVGVATAIDPNWLDFLSKEEKLDTAMKLEEAGNTMLDRGNIVRAEELFREALEIKPDFGNAMIGLGRVYLNYGKEDIAIQMFQKALDNDPFLPDFAYGNLGVIYERRGELDKALYCYKKASEVAPEATGSLINIGQVYLDMEKPDTAAIYFKQAIENISDMEVAYRGSMIFARRVHPEKVEMVKTIDEKLAEGISAEELSLYDRDIFEYSRIHTDRSRAAHHLLGISLAIQGRFDEGIEYLEIAEKIAPNDPVIKGDLRLARTEREKAGM